jgi:DNA-binding CsgD family transcriptional regulator
LIAQNVDHLVMPVLRQLADGLPPEQRQQCDRLRENLEHIISPFVDHMGRAAHGLTPAEIRLCDLIRRGLSAKEIARLEHISVATVHKHRENIRRKMGIQHRAVNLVACLQEFRSLPHPQGPKQANDI